MKKFTKAAFAIALAAGSLFAAGAPAQAVTVCAVDNNNPAYDGYIYRVNDSATTGYHYYKTYSSAYTYLHGPNSWTGYIQQWYVAEGTQCPKWYTVHTDSSTTS